MHYHFKIHKEGKGYWAECMELPGCVTQASSKRELDENMEEALNIYLQEPQDSTFLAPLPKQKIKGRNVVRVSVDPEIAFAFMVRHHRIKNKLTQKQAAKKLGFQNVYSYQRLERKCNARLDMIAKLKELFPQFSLDVVFS
jgi:antitoxin HicB